MNTRSMLLLGATVLGSVWMAGCDEDQNRVDSQDEMSRPGDPVLPGEPGRVEDGSLDGQRGTGAKAPDNTIQNRGDAASGAKTPFDQGESAADIRVTADIRKAILASDGMSVNGQNVKVITRDGVVTLRGVVESPSEIDTISDIARRTSGVTQIQNELRVDPN